MKIVLFTVIWILSGLLSSWLVGWAEGMYCVKRGYTKYRDVIRRREHELTEELFSVLWNKSKIIWWLFAYPIPILAWPIYMMGVELRISLKVYNELERETW